MELGQHSIQIFISLIVILAAAFVALVCDLLKGNNDQLRELAIELRVRREEEQRRAQMMPARTMEPAADSAPPTSTEPVKEPVKKAQFARAVAAPPDRKRTIAPEAMAAMERGAQLAGAKRTKAPEPIVVAPAAESPAPAVVAHAMAAPIAQPVTAAARPSIVVGKKDWASLLSRRDASAPASVSEETKTAEPVASQ